MKTYKKIDLYFNGDYITSTNQSKTCKEAIQKYIEKCERLTYTLGGLSMISTRVLANKHLLKARFSK